MILQPNRNIRPLFPASHIIYIRESIATIKCTIPNTYYVFWDTYTFQVYTFRKCFSTYIRQSIRETDVFQPITPRKRSLPNGNNILWYLYACQSATFRKCSIPDIYNTFRYFYICQFTTPGKCTLSNTNHIVRHLYCHQVTTPGKCPITYGNNVFSYPHFFHLFIAHDSAGSNRRHFIMNATNYYLIWNENQ